MAPKIKDLATVLMFRSMVFDLVRYSPQPSGRAAFPIRPPRGN
jgi:hypothetical protein